MVSVSASLLHRYALQLSRLELLEGRVAERAGHDLVSVSPLCKQKFSGIVVEWALMVQLFQYLWPFCAQFQRRPGHFPV